MSAAVPSPSSAPVPRPRQIASCVNCRSRKVKCDRLRPSCSRCVKHKQNCCYFGDGKSFDDVPGKKVPVMLTREAGGYYWPEGQPPQSPAVMPILPQPAGGPLGYGYYPYWPGPGQPGQPGQQQQQPVLQQQQPVPQQPAPPLPPPGQSRTLPLPTQPPSTPSSTLTHGLPPIQPPQPPGQTASTAQPLPTPPQANAPPNPPRQVHAGRIVADAGGVLHYSQSFFSAVLKSATPVKSMDSAPGESSSVPFFCATKVVPPPTLAPPKRILDSLLHTYTSDIHSVIRIVDLTLFYKDMERFEANPNSLTAGRRSLLYAMLFFAADVHSKMSRTTNPQMDTSEIDTWRKRLQSAAKDALSESEFLLKPDFHAIRAFILLMYCDVGESLTKGAGLMELPILIRLAQSVGLHRDPSNFPGMFTFAECEMRRRTWIYVQHLDSFYSRSFGLEPMVSDKMFDTRFPLLVNDVDLHGSEIEESYNDGSLHRTSHEEFDGLFWPIIPDEMDWNDMCQSTIHTSTPVLFRRLYQRLVCPRPNPIEEDLALLNYVRDFHERLFAVTYRCDSRSRRTAFCMSRLVNSRCLIYLYTPYLSGGAHSSASADLREHVFTTSLASLEYALEMTLSPYYVNQQWFSRKYTQVEHLLFLLTKLKLDPQWKEQQRAWQLACRTCEAYTKGHFADSSSKGWHACIKLRDIVSRTLGLQIDLGSEKWPLSVEYQQSLKRESREERREKKKLKREEDWITGGAVVPASGASSGAQTPPITRVTSLSHEPVSDTSSPSVGMQPPLSHPIFSLMPGSSDPLNPADILDSNLFAFPMAVDTAPIRDSWAEELGDSLDWNEWDKMVQFIRTGTSTNNQ